MLYTFLSYREDDLNAGLGLTMRLQCVGLFTRLLTIPSILLCNGSRIGLGAGKFLMRNSSALLKGCRPLTDFSM
jgi:hypothetical protein